MEGCGAKWHTFEMRSDEADTSEHDPENLREMEKNGGGDDS